MRKKKYMSGKEEERRIRKKRKKGIKRERKERPMKDAEQEVSEEKRNSVSMRALEDNREVTRDIARKRKESEIRRRGEYVREIAKKHNLRKYTSGEMLGSN